MCWILPDSGEDAWKKWQRTIRRLHYEHMLVDNCAMQLVKDPCQFDVILTENMFGDILIR